jgi:uncharacterized protein
VSAPSGSRHPLPDALRALALIGVLVVNAAGYAVAPWGPLLGRTVPAGDPLATAVQGLQAALLQGKAYPLLAVLFGMGLVWAMRRGRPNALASARRRQWRLLLLGLLHGLFLYFGDILTLYAIAGLLVLRHVHAPWTQLRRMLRRAWWWALGLALVGLALALLVAGLPGEPERQEPTLAAVDSLRAFLSVNASAYLVLNAFGMVFALPLVRALLLTGVAAARLRWLLHPRWRTQRQRLASRWLWPALALNVGYAAVVVVAAAGQGTARLLWVESAGPLVCLPLTLCLTAWLAQRWHAGQRRWAERLAPLGQRTLSLYLFHAVWCVLLFSGIGLAWQPSTLVLMGVTLGLWLVAWQLAQRSRRRWPMEAWLGHGR